ncbi:hypothetical protein Ait01nite_079300 [Actinoplanes italicus]|uniref:Uncharacterized protein n=1 Tax=Actinoplanes italicus TaxID=113567 RepID=A0A2T0JRZ1_9ACTN|nr:hypothetical protein [Actinoplanes italicus]PRX10192.1 hypothetical protein CLV67_13477 [Actinoplanes italicus]GIE34885.1 hypothetical protein Ait01nite_079300 [Actinoplanes italicus]
MPRRRPGALRATQRTSGHVRQWARDSGTIDRLSAATTAAIRLVEYRGYFGGHRHDGEPYDHDPFHEHVRPGRTGPFLKDYRAFLRRPGRRLRLEASICPSCPGCQYMDLALVRDALETITRLLPPPARGEMRRLLNRLDQEFRRRTLPDSHPRSSWAGETLPWWHRRIYQN